MGRVQVIGDAEEVWLTSGGRRTAPGSVSAGSYAIVIVVDGAEAPAGRVDVAAGETVTLKCNKAFRQCRKQ